VRLGSNVVLITWEMSVCLSLLWVYFWHSETYNRSGLCRTKQQPLALKNYFSKRQPIKSADKTSVKKVPTPSQAFKTFENTLRHHCNNTTFKAWTGPEGSRKLRLPDFVTTAQDGGKVVSLTHRPPLPPDNTTGTHFC
jgi:hypothetical protein